MFLSGFCLVASGDLRKTEKMEIMNLLFFYLFFYYNLFSSVLVWSLRTKNSFQSSNKLSLSLFNGVLAPK